ncbi:MAG: GNAT family N-acetyltransferase [Acidimicrobiales bacterium]
MPVKPVGAARAGDLSEGSTLRDVRLAALTDSPAAFGSSLERELGWGEDEWDERASQGAASEDRATWFAVDGDSGEVVGIVGAIRPDPAGSDVELVSMWAAPAARRRGVGRTLVDAVLEWAQEGGAGSVSLWVTRGNDAAERLYREMGFVETGDRQPLPSDSCKDELRMTRSA